MSFETMQLVLGMARKRARGERLKAFYGDSVAGEFQRARLRHELVKRLNVSVPRADQIIQELVR